jgi:hypothetical protein
MMRFLLPAALAIALLMSSFAVQAGLPAPGVRSYAVIGYGLDSYGTWTAARRNHQDFGPKIWILGFLSGVGFLGFWQEGINPLNGLDAEAVLAWMDNYCQKHPLVLIADAGEAFVREHPH